MNNQDFLDHEIPFSIDEDLIEGSNNIRQNR